MKKKIAVLITCHNRREKTLECLNSLFATGLPIGHRLSVFLVDDGSVDGTGEAVKKEFSEVHVIQGDGNLFWNRGMRLAWEIAAKEKDFDYYLWLNDDAILDNYAITELIECYTAALEINNKPAIIVGACKTKLNDFSYGGRTEKGPVIPNGKIQPCKYINGNAVLIPKTVYLLVGNLSTDYTHAMGDFDYGLRALNKGCEIYTTREYVAKCKPNELATWCDSNTPILKRWKLLHSPKGLNIKEYNTFRKKFWGWKWVLFAAKAYLKVLFPNFYYRFKKYI